MHLILDSFAFWDAYYCHVRCSSRAVWKCRADDAFWESLILKPFRLCAVSCRYSDYAISASISTISTTVFNRFCYWFDIDFNKHCHCAIQFSECLYVLMSVCICPYRHYVFRAVDVAIHTKVCAHSAIVQFSAVICICADKYVY